jgi:hypothetical protein
MLRIALGGGGRGVFKGGRGRNDFSEGAFARFFGGSDSLLLTARFLIWRPRRGDSRCFLV